MVKTRNYPSSYIKEGKTNTSLHTSVVQSGFLNCLLFVHPLFPFGRIHLKKRRGLIITESGDSRSGSDLHCSRTATGSFSYAEILNE